MEEGCLSIPGINEDVTRPDEVHLRYYDQNWELHEETFRGMAGRIIQHEYDHLEGVLFTDHLSNLRKTMIRNKLKDIAYGRIDPGYKMIYPNLKKKK
jgi:peptide deformylase